jgi:hypothetical protein
MSIQIDQSLFLPKIKRFASKNKPRFQDEQVDLAREVLEEAQSFMDDQPWKGQPEYNWDTQRECRIEMKRYILNKIDLSDDKKSYFVPTFVWVFVARLVINYIVKLIIEHYWSDLQKEIGIDY